MSDVIEIVGFLLLLALVSAIVLSVLFLPIIVASNRGSVSYVGILLVNLLGLVTGFFWFVALLWACLGATKPLPPPPSARIGEAFSN